jgi:hypothetical protein
MTLPSTQPYLDPTQESGAAFFSRRIPGPIVMLNLLRFREIADYSSNPHLAPAAPITGREAYQRYMDHTLPYLKASGGEVTFLGDAYRFLIGPCTERWDTVMMVRQKSSAAFLAFASNPECMAGIGHRLAALEDSRLLPIVESTPQDVLRGQN